MEAPPILQVQCLLLVICQTQRADLMTAQFAKCKLHTFSIDTSSFQQPYMKINHKVAAGAKGLKSTSNLRVLRTVFNK